MTAIPVLSEVVMERNGRVLAAYHVHRDVQGDLVLLDQEKPRVDTTGLWNTAVTLVAALLAQGSRLSHECQSGGDQ
ncbi:hypothetical protein GCM10027290_44940 [Micromonospora sonneratiae]|uniref:Uncharacterized protein n=1 Tax=Micromonospora sonneratiae TaxID=1184706 RepID=A0ABW3Y9W0_9ACTN